MEVKLYFFMKLMPFCIEMEVKEEKVQQLLKQLEIKTSDTQKYRTAAEAAKVNKHSGYRGGYSGTVSVDGLPLLIKIQETP